MPERTPPLRRRGAAVTEAIMTAGRAELAECGPEDATVAGVAARAGLHETTIYRRYPTRESLFVAVLLADSEERIPVPDTGSLRGDLLETLRLTQLASEGPLGLALLYSGAFAAGRYDAERRQFWRARILAFVPIFTRAIDRGELADTVDIPLALEMLTAPIHSRVMVTGFPLTDDLSTRVVDTLLNGLPTLPPQPAKG